MVSSDCCSALISSEVGWSHRLPLPSTDWRQLAIIWSVILRKSVVMRCAVE